MRTSANGESRMANGGNSARFAIRYSLLAVSLFLPACVEERVVYDRPLLSGLPGTETSRPVTGPRYSGPDPRAEVADDQIVVKNPDGTKTLIAKTGRHLMIHIHNALQEDDAATFVDQILSEQTREEYYRRGLDPVEAFKTLKKHRADVKKLFDQMPMGEYTPGLYVRNMPGKITRLEANGSGIRDLDWIAIDMVMEQGNWKLVWFAGRG